MGTTTTTTTTVVCPTDFEAPGVTTFQDNVFVSWDVDADHQVRCATVNTTAIEAFGDVFSNSTLFWESCNSGTDLVFADTDSGGQPVYCDNRGCVREPDR